MTHFHFAERQCCYPDSRHQLFVPPASDFAHHDDFCPRYNSSSVMRHRRRWLIMMTSFATSVNPYTTIVNRYSLLNSKCDHCHRAACCPSRTVQTLICVAAIVARVVYRPVGGIGGLGWVSGDLDCRVQRLTCPVVSLPQSTIHDYITHPGVISGFHLFGSSHCCFISRQVVVAVRMTENHTCASCNARFTNPLCA